VGGIRSYEISEELIEKELVDYISLSRPLIREPQLINRWEFSIANRVTRISCNKCFVPARAGKGIYCVLER